MAQPMRAWCAECQYPGHAKFVLGTAMVPNDARHDEIMTALIKLWEELSPHPRPLIFVPVAGMIWFQEENES
jgi:hypothetical protein